MASASTRDGSVCSGSSTRMGAAIEVIETGYARRRAAWRRWSPAPARCRRRGSGPGRCRWRSTSCRSSASQLLRRRRDGRLGRRGATSQGVGSDRDRGRRASRGIGAEIEATADGFVVTGAGRLRGGVLDAGGDHRLAMLGAIAGLASAEGVEVGGFDAAGVSYPGFARDLGSLLAPR